MWLEPTTVRSAEPASDRLTTGTSVGIYRVAINFCGFLFLRFCSRSAEIFSAENLFHFRSYIQTSPLTCNVNIFVDCLVIVNEDLMVDIDCGTKSDSEDEVQYRCGEENASDNASSVTIVTAAHALPEQTIILGQFQMNATS